MTAAALAFDIVAIPGRIMTDEVHESLECLATALAGKYHRGGAASDTAFWHSRRFRVFITRRYAATELHYATGGL